jgi:hypothetical protein
MLETLYAPVVCAEKRLRMRVTEKHGEKFKCQIQNKQDAPGSVGVNSLGLHK